MGYRTYIGSLPKEEHEKIKNLTIEEFYTFRGKKLTPELDDYIGVYDVVTKRLFEFGKYTEFDDKKFYKPVFLNDETQKEFNAESDFWIVEKDYLKHIIDHYTEKVKSYYNDLIKDVPYDAREFELPKEKQIQMAAHIQSMAREWGLLGFGLIDKPFNLDEGDSITTSWKYEYETFELVRIYKTFDWENNIMIYYGY